MTHKAVEKYLLSMPDSKLEYPFGEEAAVYKAKLQSNEWKMFAIIREDKDPVQVSLKCDAELSKVLRDKYESVMPGHHLNKKHWNTIVLTGQLPWDEIKILIKHSYDLVTKNDSDIPAIG